MCAFSFLSFNNISFFPFDNTDSVKFVQPYLHESRHLHALKRARSSSGRFLNTKNLQQSPSIISELPSASQCVQTWNNLTNTSPVLSEFLRSENCRDSTSNSNTTNTTTCSDVTRATNKSQMSDDESNLRLCGRYSSSSYIGSNMQSFSIGHVSGDEKQHSLSVFM